jgi:hypothetical protein
MRHPELILLRSQSLDGCNNVQTYMAVTYYVALPFIRTEEGTAPGLGACPDNRGGNV